MASGIHRVEYQYPGKERKLAKLKGDGYYFPAYNTPEFTIPVDPGSKSYTILDIWVYDFAGNMIHATIKYWLEPGHVKAIHSAKDKSKFLMHIFSKQMNTELVTEKFITHIADKIFEIAPYSDEFMVLKIKDQQEMS